LFIDYCLLIIGRWVWSLSVAEMKPKRWLLII